MQKYFLKWKGVESGPYSSDELADMYRLGKIGLLHSVRAESSEDEWVFFRDFLSSGKIEHAPSGEKESPRGVNMMFVMQIVSYIFCGLSFVSIIYYVCAILFAAGFFFVGDRRAAWTLGGISTGLLLLGRLFFKIIMPVISE